MSAAADRCECTRWLLNNQERQGAALYTNSMVLNPFSEAAIYEASQKYHNILWNLKDSHHVYWFLS
jgi:hypothetical protein